MKAKNNYFRSKWSDLFYNSRKWFSLKTLVLHITASKLGDKKFTLCTEEAIHMPLNFQEDSALKQ